MTHGVVEHVVEMVCDCNVIGFLLVNCGFSTCLRLHKILGNLFKSCAYDGKLYLKETE